MKVKTKRKKIRASFSQSSDMESSQSSDMESSDLHLSVFRIAVAQICNSVGYTGAQTSALKTLTAVAVRYLQSLAKSAANSASSTGRTKCNLLDIIRALEDLHSDVGFHGNSDRKRRLYILSDSSILIDTMKFVYLTPEIPFAKPLPRHSQTLPPNPASFSDESGKWNHVPRWLPVFPKTSDVAEETVIPAPIEDETAWEKTESNRKISKLPEKRKKVSFTIGGGGRNVIKMQSEVDLRDGICKGGKRISCQIYEDENFVSASCSSNHDLKPKPSMKKKLQDCDELIYI
ncbi:hypothetical protein L1987_42195 [Smallanthus sonchifolius]|uniref:Uncharacterized protein n=1 Tax=Smallanthus sonchifolius TaxID=185202 RepID=A0ACB9GX15_9ASTR|nr:hypothetical protein L1987_42195 [Smallanthus sonchifolius]